MTDTLIGLAHLMRRAHHGEDLTPLGNQLLAQAEHAKDAECANHLLDLSLIFQIRGQREVALNMQAAALHLRRVFHTPLTGDAPPSLRVLAVLSDGDAMANTPLELLLENSGIALDLLYLRADEPIPVEIPDHDVLFVAVCESDANQRLLHQLAETLRHWPRPVVNRPERIAGLTREGTYAQLNDVAGVAIPPSCRIGRVGLAQLGFGAAPDAVLPGGRFPLIARPANSHAGQGLVKLESPADVSAYLAAQAEVAEFSLSNFVDYRSADDLYRKFRLVLVDGQPFAGHMGVSGHWIIHYVNAGMTDDAAKRNEEAAFMARFEQDFAVRHQAALVAIQQRFGLDYLVIDCAETPDGDLLVFEVDSGAVVHALDPVELFPYKVAPMEKVFAAFRALLHRRAGR